MSGAVWRLEWRVALTRRRLLAWNVAVPLVLLGPVAASAAAAPHRAAVFSVFFVIFAVFGSCIPLVRDGASGWTEKLLLTGYPPRAWLAERVAAGAALDAVQLLPTFALLAVLADGRAGWAAVGGLALALVAANLLGVVVAALVRSLAEGALVCSAGSLLALHLAGVFRAAAPGSHAAAIRGASPFAPLDAGMRGLAEAAPGAAVPAEWLSSLAVTGLATAAILAAAPAVVRRLARVAE